MRQKLRRQGQQKPAAAALHATSMYWSTAVYMPAAAHTKFSTARLLAAGPGSRQGYDTAVLNLVQLYSCTTVQLY